MLRHNHVQDIILHWMSSKGEQKWEAMTDMHTSVCLMTLEVDTFVKGGFSEDLLVG